MPDVLVLFAGDAAHVATRKGDGPWRHLRRVVPGEQVAGLSYEFLRAAGPGIIHLQDEPGAGSPRHGDGPRYY